MSMQTLWPTVRSKCLLATARFRCSCRRCPNQALVAHREGAPLYNVTATWSPASVSTPQLAPLRLAKHSGAALGFRAFTVVTINDTDAATVAANATSDG